MSAAKAPTMTHQDAWRLLLKVWENRDKAPRKWKALLATVEALASDLPDPRRRADPRRRRTLGKTEITIGGDR